MKIVIKYIVKLYILYFKLMRKINYLYEINIILKIYSFSTFWVLYNIVINLFIYFIF